MVKNLTADRAPIDGDFIEVTHENGALERKHYFAPVVPTAAQLRRAEIFLLLAKIDADTTKPRTMRELQLNKTATKAWLQAQDDEAALLRAELAAL